MCERARGWAALAPDGELSELERKLLESHLRRCGPCGHFAVQVALVADALRAARLEPLPRSVSVPVWRRRPVYARMRTVGAAAAVAAMALGIASREPLAPGDRSAFDLPRVTNFANKAPEREVELILRRAANLEAASTRFRPRVQGRSTRPI
ncbi:MAG: zf-HC2 domain-containing protein [Gaiellaceae bacterium]